VGGVLSLKGLLTLALVGLALYFGWPVIEATLIILPIPDPADLSEKIKSWASSLRQAAFGGAQKAGASKKGAGYTGNFNQKPETLGESDEEGEDDTTRTPTLTQRKSKKGSGSSAATLSYGDSDDEEKDAAELIQLDGAATHFSPPIRAAEIVPKLAKPE
jgi:hypothetical protein